MRILELCEFYSNYSGNFIPSIKALGEALVDKGHEIYYIFSNANLSEDFYKWEKPFSLTHNVLLFDFSSKECVENAVDFIKKNKIDIVHGHFLSSKLFSDIKRKSPKNVVFYQHIHNTCYEKKNLYAFLKRIRNLFFLRHDITRICCSNAITYSAKYMFPYSKVISLKNAIDFSRLEKASFNRIKENSILMFGHNFFIKGVDLAIKVIMSLPEECCAHLNIVMGDKIDENKKIIREMFGDVKSRVTILPPTNNVIDLYKTHQIFLNASIEEGMSYANIEAYYSGMLFVASNIPQNTEPGLPNVIYFENKNMESLKESLLGSFKKINTYKNDCDYVEKYFSISVWVDGMLSIFGL